jgi:hypothetical protein
MACWQIGTPDRAPLGTRVHLAAVAHMQAAGLGCLVLRVLAGTGSPMFRHCTRRMLAGRRQAIWVASVGAHLHILLLPGRCGQAAPHAQLLLCSPLWVILPQGRL